MTPAVARDATRVNWWRKRRAFASSHLYLATNSQWLMERARRSLLAPALIDSRVIVTGIDLRQFRPAPKTEARATLPLPADGHLAVFAAFQALANPRKDYPTLRAAFAHLGHEGLTQPLHLAVIGQSGPVERHGLVTIHHLPFLPAEQLVRYYQAADLYVHAARCEIFGLVLAEAMACGTPVVATAVGGIPEVVESGKHGILTPPGDAPALAAAVRALLADPARRAALGRQALAHARQRFDEEQTVRRYLEWFAEILANDRGRTAQPRALFGVA
ncbi:MAG: glycosyltransferase [Planctomycetia bacterium]|nr:glycosyltransferase [Planctomycetia bacterium]